MWAPEQFSDTSPYNAYPSWLIYTPHPSSFAKSHLDLLKQLLVKAIWEGTLAFEEKVALGKLFNLSVFSGIFWKMDINSQCLGYYKVK